MIKIIICDDDFTVKLINELLAKAIKTSKVNAKIVCKASSGTDILNFIQNTSDSFLYFLDFDFGKKEKNPNQQIMTAACIKYLKMADSDCISPSETHMIELPIGIDKTISLPLSDILYVDSIKTIAHSICYHTFSAYVLHLTCVFLPYVLKTRSYACSLMLTITATLLFFFLATVFTRLKFLEKLLRLNHFGEKYPDIEKYFPRFSGIILLLFVLIFIPFTVLQLRNTLITLLIPFLCHAVLCAQLPFNVLLFKIAFYKNAATYRQSSRKCQSI